MFKKKRNHGLPECPLNAPQILTIVLSILTVLMVIFLWLHFEGLSAIVAMYFVKFASSLLPIVILIFAALFLLGGCFCRHRHHWWW